MLASFAEVMALPGISAALPSGEDTQTNPSLLVRSIGSGALYARGITGAGVTVAVIDTGVADVPGLSGDEVIHGPDLSFEGGIESLYNRDSYGHRTVMAAMIGGNDDVRAFVTSHRPTLAGLLRSTAGLNED